MRLGYGWAGVAKDGRGGSGSWGCTVEMRKGYWVGVVKIV